MNDPAATREDRALLAAFQHLDAQGGAGERPVAMLPDSTDDEARELRAAFELIGLLPYALEPAMPRPELRAEILGQARRRTAARPTTVDGATPPTVDSDRGRDIDELTWAGNRTPPDFEHQVDSTLVRPGAGLRSLPATAAQLPSEEEGRDRPALETLAPSHRFERAPRGREARGRWLPLALAAGLAFALLGLGYLSAVVRQQSARLGGLEETLQATAHEAVLLRERNAELETVRQRFAMITAVAQRAYPMKAMPAADRQLPALAGGGEPTGVVFVCGNHQQWYLNLRGLPPAPQGRQYNLWFLTPDGALDAGVLDVRADRPAEAEAPSMPEGTTGFAVTLESLGPHSSPQGPFVLLGDDSVSL